MSDVHHFFVLWKLLCPSPWVLAVPLIQLFGGVLVSNLSGKSE